MSREDFLLLRKAARMAGQPERPRSNSSYPGGVIFKQTTLKDSTGIFLLRSLTLPLLRILHLAAGSASLPCPSIPQQTTVPDMEAAPSHSQAPHRLSHHLDNARCIACLSFAIISPLKADWRKRTFSPLGSFQCKSLIRTCLLSDLIQLYLFFSP